MKQSEIADVCGPSRRRSVVRRVAGMCLSVWLLQALAAPGAEPRGPLPKLFDLGDMKPGTGEQTVMVQHADDVEYNTETGWIHATGGVVVVSGEQELRADRIDVDVQRNMAWAQGNVVFRRGKDDSNVLRCDNLEYDITKRTVNVQRLKEGVRRFVL